VFQKERERERERVECFGLGISFERNAPLSSSPYQINSMKLKCPNIPYNFVRESLVEGRCYVVVVFQWRIIWCYRYRYHPFLPLSIYGSNEAWEASQGRQKVPY
jgi:hypothetical protein